MNRELSFNARLHRAIGSQCIEEVKANHAYLHALGYNYEEFANYWNTSKNATWAHGFGRMVGFDEVFASSVSLDTNWYGHYPEEAAAYPEIIGMDPRAVGTSGVHVLASSVIEIADDGLTGRSFYLTPGTMTGSLSPAKKRSGNILWERYGSDFCYEEDGRWLYFHEQVCPDIPTNYCQANWAYDPYCKVKAEGGRFSSRGGDDAPHITERDDKYRHRDYHLLRTVQNTAPWPEPYATMDDENTYSPGKTDPNLR